MTKRASIRKGELNTKLQLEKKKSSRLMRKLIRALTPKTNSPKGKSLAKADKKSPGRSEKSKFIIYKRRKTHSRTNDLQNSCKKKFIEVIEMPVSIIIIVPFESFE